MNLFGCLLRPTLATVAMLGTLMLMDSGLRLPLHLHFIIQIVLGAAVYLTTLILLWELAGQPASGEKVLLDNILAKLGRSPG